jgi:LuxR family maltose regulon positive regulatory protein
MESSFQTSHDSFASYHFERPRLNELLLEASKYPLVVVCAGAGYGKTTAVHDFLKKYKAAKVWMQLSERDNVGSRFWENFIHSIKIADPSAAEAFSKIDFPDTKEKHRHYQTMTQKSLIPGKKTFVIDDFHCIEDPSVLRFMEECFFSNIPPETTIFLISRSMSRVNTAGMLYRGQAFNVSESELRFTENELSQYLRRLGISFKTESLYEIMQDTEGWAFAINVIARSYQTAPGYSGYVRNAMKLNIFRFLDTEIWPGIPDRLQNFLVRLSLIDHLSVDLLTKLAGKEEKLIEELEKQSAYVRLDSYINAYLIHPLFLEFIRTKQDSLPEKEKKKVYVVSGDWCANNGFKVDAISYYEKAGLYQAIVTILDSFSVQMPLNIAQFAAPILDNAPADTFDKVEFLAEMHLRTHLCQGHWQKSLDLLQFYEAKFLKLPENDIVRNRTLAQLYVCWTYVRSLMSTTDDIFDAEIYMGKAIKCVSNLDGPGKFGPYYSGAWINYAGSSRKGSPDEFLAVVTRIGKNMTRSFYEIFIKGELELMRGELEFYRGDVNSALSLLTLSVKEVRGGKQFSFLNRALYYTLRIAVSQGNFTLAEQALKDIKDQQNEAAYLYRFIDYDIALSWYYCFLGMPDKTSEWLQEDFSPYIHAAFIENFGNQIKARFCYATRNFAPLLAYIEEMKSRESILFGRVEMLAMEACVHYLMKNKEKAFDSLRNAYENAAHNGIVMPFIEMGKDMRTLASACLRTADGTGIPKPWLEEIGRKSASYAKRRSNVIAEYARTHRLTDIIAITPRESDILKDLALGLSRAEIASGRGLSINTVKMVINSLYSKLGAENVADVIRIAAKRKMI